MSVNIDVIGVTSYVLPNMDKIRSRLDTACNDCKNLYNSLPNNFSYKTTINELCSNLYNYKNDYNNSLKIINSKISTVKNIENKTEQRVSDITSDSNAITTTIKFSETVKEERVSFFGEFKDNWLTGIDMIFGGGKKDKITFEEFLATSTNALIAFTEGILDVVENIGDASLTIGGTVVAGYASFVDLCRGDLDATCYNAVMDWTKATVANDWTNELHDFYYEDYGAILDECSADIMDSDSSGFQVAKQTGTMAGTIILATTGTPVSAGTSAAASQAANMAVVGATNSFGYNTGNEWNKNSVTISYDGVNAMDLNIDYDTYSRLENLKPGESLNVSQSYVLEDGTTQNVTYTFSKNADGNLSASDSFGNIVNTHSIEESNTYKAMLKSSVKAAWDGAQYYVGGKIAGANFTSLTGNISNSYLQVAAQSGMRIGLDTLTGAVEVPVQAGIDAIFDDISYKEAWNNQGGIKAMLTQTAIAAGSSLAGEGFAYIENVKANQLTSILQTGDSHLITSSVDSYNPNVINRTLSEMNTTDATNLFKSVDFEQKVKFFNNMDVDTFRKYSRLLEEGELKKIVQNMDNKSYERIIDGLEGYSVAELKRLRTTVDSMQLTEQEKNIVKQVSSFFEMNNDIFIKFSSVKEKRKIVKKIYEILHYDDMPQLYSMADLDSKEGVTIYRGISANNNDELKKYVNEFINGEVFYGGRAAIYGTGIYTVAGDSSVASKYASDGGINNCGIIIESKLEKDCKIIENSKISETKSIVFEKMREMYNQNIEEFLSILEDDGVFAAILGYDAIYVKEKDYIVVLNRKKMIVNDIDIFNKLNSNQAVKN